MVVIAVGRSVGKLHSKERRLLTVKCYGKYEKERDVVTDDPQKKRGKKQSTVFSASEASSSRTCFPPLSLRSRSQLHW